MLMTCFLHEVQSVPGAVASKWDSGIRYVSYTVRQAPAAATARFVNNVPFFLLSLSSNSGSFTRRLKTSKPYT